MNEVIDLCDSSDEDDFTVQPNHSSGKRVVPSSKSRKNEVFIASTESVAAKPKEIITFWDSSSDDEVRESSSRERKGQRERRKSQLVTPEDHRRLKPSTSWSSSDEDEMSLGEMRRYKRKNPRTLFPITNKSANLSSTPTLEPDVNKKSVATSRSLFTNNSLVCDDSSSDDSLPTTSGLKKEGMKLRDKIAAKRQLPISKVTTKLASRNIGKDKSSDFSSDEDDALIICNTMKVLQKNAFAVSNSYRKETSFGNTASLPLHPSDSKRLFRETVQYPPVGPASCRQYEDLRAKYILALWRYSQTLVSASYNLPKLDSCCRRIKELALSAEFPIRSLGEYLGGGYSIEFSSLKEALSIGGLHKIHLPHSDHSTTRDGFFSIQEAALVAMLEMLQDKATEQGICLDDSNDAASFCRNENHWVFLSEIIPEIDKRLNASFAHAKLQLSGEDDNGEAHYSLPSTRSSEYKQLEQLTKSDARLGTPLLKAHRRNKRICYELTELGLQKAWYVRSRKFPEPPGYLRSSKLFQDTVSKSFGGICLVVDSREGGGASKKLHYMCHSLDIRKVPYLVTQLDVGDYAFVCTESGKLFPIIVERKSIQDVAQSIWDGRWASQKSRMYKGQYVFGYEHCRMIYLIEGHADGHELSGGAIGQERFDVSRERLESEIENLKGEGFEVLKTNNMKGSLAQLVELSKSIAFEVQRGKMQASLTYDEFMKGVAAVPSETDFARMAKDRRFLARSPLAPPPSVKTDAVDPIPTKTNTSTSQFSTWKVSELKCECEKFGLSKTGKKLDLIRRLEGPKPPSIWLERKRQSLYVPARHDTCGSAILVALWLEQQRSNTTSWKGMEKEGIIALAESLHISKDPFTGTGKGVFDYDGWSCMGPLKEGPVPLVYRGKGGYYLLSESGVVLASTMHDWCHAHGKCECGR